MEAGAKNSGYPESVIGDAAGMKGRMKRAEDVSRDGPPDPSLTRTYRRGGRGPLREGIIKVIE